MENNQGQDRDSRRQDRDSEPGKIPLGAFLVLLAKRARTGKAKRKQRLGKEKHTEKLMPNDQGPGT